MAAAGLCAALLAGCSDSRPADSATSTPGTDQDKSSGTVTLVTYDSFPLSDETAAAFTDKTGYQLKVVKNGDGVELTNKLVLTKDAPLGDAVFGSITTPLRPPLMPEPWLISPGSSLPACKNCAEIRSN